MDLLDRVHQICRFGILKEVAQSPGLDCRKDLVVTGKTGQHQDTWVGLVGRDLASGFDPIHARHYQVHQDHIRAQGIRPGHSLLPITGLPNHLYILNFCQQSPDALADDGVVVHN